MGMLTVASGFATRTNPKVNALVEPPIPRRKAMKGHFRGLSIILRRICIFQRNGKQRIIDLFKAHLVLHRKAAMIFSLMAAHTSRFSVVKEQIGGLRASLIF